MTLTIKTPAEQQASMAARALAASERAANDNRTLDGRQCDANGIYTDPVTGKQYLSVTRLEAAIAATALGRSRSAQTGYCKGI